MDYLLLNEKKILNTEVMYIIQFAKSVWLYVAYQAVSYLKSYNKFYEDLFISKRLSFEATFRFYDIIEVQGKKWLKNVF